MVERYLATAATPPSAPLAPPPSPTPVPSPVVVDFETRRRQLEQVQTWAATLGPQRWKRQYRYIIRRRLGDSHEEAFRLVVREHEEDEAQRTGMEG